MVCVVCMYIHNVGVAHRCSDVSLAAACIGSISYFCCYCEWEAVDVRLRLCVCGGVRTYVRMLCVCVYVCMCVHACVDVHVQHCICMNLCADVSACVLCRRIVQSCVTTPQTGSHLQCQLRDTGTWYNVITPHALTSL